MVSKSIDTVTVRDRNVLNPNMNRFTAERMLVFLLDVYNPPMPFSLQVVCGETIILPFWSMASNYLL